MPQTKRLIIDLKRRTAVIPLLLVLMTAAGVVAQQARSGPAPLETGTATIRGTVLDAQTREPVADANVRVFDSGRARTGLFRSGLTKTSADGRYEFAGIAEGQYAVFIDSQSYLRPSQSSQVNTFSDQVSTQDFQLTPGATARGRVVDRQGKPVAGARVNFAARGHFAPMGGPFRPTVTSADGSFTMTLVPAGEWTIEVSLPRPRGALQPPLIYHPGVLWREEAETIKVRTGETLDNIEVVVPRVIENGLTVHVPASPPVLEHVSVSVLSAAPLAVRAIGLDERGAGTIKGLIEGRYFVAARAWSRDQAFVAFQAVDLVTDSQEVSLHLQRAGRITGRVVAQRGRLPALDGIRVGAAWVHDDVQINPLVPDNVVAGPDGRFTIDGLFGRRKIELGLGGLSPDWRIHSVLMGRTDVTSGVEVPLNSTIDLTIVLARR